jgi:hypothetical protein
MTFAPFVTVTPRRLAWTPTTGNEVKFIRFEPCADGVKLKDYSLVGDGFQVIPDRSSITERTILLAVRPLRPMEEATCAVRVRAEVAAGVTRERFAFLVNTP